MKTIRTLIFCFVYLATIFPFTAHTFAQQQAQEVILPLEELRIETKAGKFTFSVEIADDQVERSIGLMFRTAMAPNRGMLFDFGRTEPIAMWMKNTPLSLDMVFVRPDGTVLRVANDTKPFSTDIITSGGAVSHVLEINAGIAKQIGLSTGDRIIHPHFSTTN